MKTIACLVRNILVRWFRNLRAPAAALALAGGCFAATAPLSTLQKNYRVAPAASTRAKLLAYVQAHPGGPNSLLVRFTLGMTAFTKKEYAEAAAQLKLAQLPQLGDYIAYYLAAARAELNDYADIPRDLALFEKPAPLLSPLQANAALLAAKAYLHNQAPGDAIRVLRQAYKQLPQPEGDFALASAYGAQGELSQAAILYQCVYYEFPAKPAAAEASAVLDQLRQALGKAYPPPMPKQMLDRGAKWIAARDYLKARHEFESLIPLLGGVERDQARVRIGAADYASGNSPGAWRYLKALRLPRSEADAERHYYLSECARKMNDDAAMSDALKQLAEHYSQSVWRLKALVSAGNRYLLQHQPSKYEPLYRAAYETFPPDPATAYCHWKVAWNAYVARRANAADLMHEQVTLYPDDGKAAAALYFLGRLAEAESDRSTAYACYRKLAGTFPHFYYGVLARDRIAEAKLAALTPSAETAAWLGQVDFPKLAVKDLAKLEPSAATGLRIERARLLADAGFADWAETELRFGAKNDGQPHLIAMELARSVAPHRGLRYMKTLVPDYLSIPFESAPIRFWQAMFPMPFQQELVYAARQQNLDPNILAALIRQESEFNPVVVSHANAYGLTQLIPATGRQVAKQIGIGGFDTSMLFEPATNLRLGSTYLRSMLNQWGGRWEPTLASYNAGKGRVDEWLAWSDYREPAEFVESIPFTETREYVQAVLRNAELYRRIYGTKLTAGPPAKIAKKEAPANKLAKTRPRARKRTHAIS